MKDNQPSKFKHRDSAHNSHKQFGSLYLSNYRDKMKTLDSVALLRDD